MNTAEEAVTAPHARSHTSVESVAAPTIPPLAVPSTRVDKQQQQVITTSSTTLGTPVANIPTEDQYVPPTPLKVDQLQMLLQDHPLPAKVSYVFNQVGSRDKGNYPK